MNQTIKIILFNMNELQFALDVNQISSIERYQEITEIPQSKNFIKGIVNLRGIITPIIDLKERLSLGITKPNTDSRILIITLNNVQIGLLVDSATEIIDINASIIDSDTNLMEHVNNDLVKGVAKFKNDLLIILNLENLFDVKEIKELAL